MATYAAAEVITGAGGLTRILTFLEVLVFEFVAVIVTTTGVPLLEVGTPLMLPVALSILRPAGRFTEAVKVAGADSGFSETGKRSEQWDRLRRRRGHDHGIEALFPRTVLCDQAPTPGAALDGFDAVSTFDTQLFGKVASECAHARHPDKAIGQL